MKEIFVLLVIMTMTMTMTMFMFIYAYQIYKHKITPTLSTWLIFFSGVGLSFVTYVISENNDLRSGILNTIDLANVVIVIIAILIWGKRSIVLKSFEKWYLIAVGFIIFYGLTTGDVWRSNILTQILIGIGYFPTFHNLLKSRINTESFLAWSVNLIAGLFALYPALVQGNILAAIYAIRTVSLITVLLVVMIYCEVYAYKRRNVVIKSS